MVCNCGYGHGATVKEVIDVVKKVSGVDFKVERGPRRAGDPAVIVARAERAREVLGWRPKRDNLEEIVAPGARLGAAAAQSRACKIARGADPRPAPRTAARSASANWRRGGPRARAPIDGWTCDGAPIARRRGVAEREGVRRFAARARRRRTGRWRRRGCGSTSAARAC